MFFRGQLALSYIAKILIVLVVVTVVIALIFNFSGDVRGWVKTLFHEEDKTKGFPSIEKRESFIASDVAVLIESCYSVMTSLPEDEQKDITCYTLISGKKFGFGAEEVMSMVPEEIRERLEVHTSFDRDVVLIQFRDVGNRIILSD